MHSSPPYEDSSSLVLWVQGCPVQYAWWNPGQFWKPIHTPLLLIYLWRATELECNWEFSIDPRISLENSLTRKKLLCEYIPQSDSKVLLRRSSKCDRDDESFYLDSSLLFLICLNFPHPFPFLPFSPSLRDFSLRKTLLYSSAPYVEQVTPNAQQWACSSLVKAWC